MKETLKKIIGFTLLLFGGFLYIAIIFVFPIFGMICAIDFVNNQTWNIVFAIFGIIGIFFSISIGLADISDRKFAELKQERKKGELQESTYKKLVLTTKIILGLIIGIITLMAFIAIECMKANQLMTAMIFGILCAIGFALALIGTIYQINNIKQKDE